MFRKKISLLILPFIATLSLQAKDPFFSDPFGDDIFKEMFQMQQEMDKIFERMHERMEQRKKLGNYPNRQILIPADRTRAQRMFEDRGTHYEYTTQVPQSPDNQIDISIENGVLHFKARVETIKKSKDPNMQIQQRYVSMVQRSQTLPKDADPRSLKSEYKNGRLVLTLQKKKRITAPAVKEKTEEKPALTPKVEETKEKKENNTTNIKVPHTSSHV